MVGLKKELEQCRRNGFVLELGDIQPGVNAIATPVLDQNGNPIGYITIVGFFTEEVTLKLGPLAADTGKIISKETGHMILWQRANNRSKMT